MFMKSVLNYLILPDANVLMFFFNDQTTWLKKRKWIPVPSSVNWYLEKSKVLENMNFQWCKTYPQHGFYFLETMLRLGRYWDKRDIYVHVYARDTNSIALTITNYVLSYAQNAEILFVNYFFSFVFYQKNLSQHQTLLRVHQVSG